MRNIIKKENKRAAMEMSVGTIVTIVLLMAALVLGLVLTYNIFTSANGAIDLTDQELSEEINTLFGDSGAKLMLYPKSGEVKIKQEEQDAIGLGIKNLLTGVSGSQKFSYEVKVIDKSRCGNANVLDWIYLGKSGSDIPIAAGGMYSTKITFNIPSGSPLCTVRYRVEVKTGGATGTSTPYDTIEFDITSKAK